MEDIAAGLLFDIFVKNAVEVVENIGFSLLNALFDAFVEVIFQNGFGDFVD